MCSRKLVGRQHWASQTFQLILVGCYGEMIDLFTKSTATTKDHEFPARVKYVCTYGTYGCSRRICKKIAHNIITSSPVPPAANTRVTIFYSLTRKKEGRRFNSKKAEYTTEQQSSSTAAAAVTTTTTSQKQQFQI